MEWIERLNQVMGYVDRQLDSQISEEDVRRIMACPYPLFQAAFSQIANCSFSEYVRRRRLTLAACELQNGRRVIDAALKYGYQSPDAFSAAFKRLHGITPSQARKPGARMTFFCRLSFQVDVKGVEAMQYAFYQKEPFQVMGVRRVTPYGGGTWAVVKSDGSNDRIQKASGRFFDLGLCFGFTKDGSNDYMCAVVWEGAPLPGYDIYRYPQADWLRFECGGPISKGVLGSAWRKINEEFLPQSIYEKSGLPTIEKYILWNESEDQCQVEILIPVRQKQT